MCSNVGHRASKSEGRSDVCAHVVLCACQTCFVLYRSGELLKKKAN